MSREFPDQAFLLANRMPLPCDSVKEGRIKRDYSAGIPSSPWPGTGSLEVPGCPAWAGSRHSQIGPRSWAEWLQPTGVPNQSFGFCLALSTM